jgi:hypothetical protein
MIEKSENRLHPFPPSHYSFQLLIISLLEIVTYFVSLAQYEISKHVKLCGALTCFLQELPFEGCLTQTLPVTAISAQMNILSHCHDILSPLDGGNDKSHCLPILLFDFPAASHCPVSVSLENFHVLKIDSLLSSTLLI